MAVSKEVKVGILAVVAGALLYVGFNFLKGIDFLSPTHTYYAVYDNIDGLQVSNPVLVNGLKVGQVNKIVLRDTDHKLVVQMEVDNTLSLGDSTRAILASNGLLEGKAIVFHIKRHKGLLEDGDTLKAEKEKGLQDIISAKAGPVINDLDTMIVGLNNVIAQVRAEERLQRIMKNFEAISQKLDILLYDNANNLKGITTNLNKLSASLVETEKSLKPLMGKFNTLADSLNEMPLAQTVENANKSMKELSGILAEINQGQGTLGKLVKTEELNTNLNKTVADLDKLFIDVQAHPKRYVHFSVFGGNKKEKKAEKKQ